LFLPTGKLGGILVESRWRGSRPEWTAIGIGINVRDVKHPGGSALGSGVLRLDVLNEILPAVRAAASGRGHLSDQELADFAARDVALGRRCKEPWSGRVSGVAADGALLIETPDGVKRMREGSLVLEKSI
jgi:biotin-(acetyl-CoA carboxylase) ligase